jgi:hypothetical protein
MEEIQLHINNFVISTGAQRSGEICGFSLPVRTLTPSGFLQVDGKLIGASADRSDNGLFMG